MDLFSGMLMHFPSLFLPKMIHTDSYLGKVLFVLSKYSLFGSPQKPFQWSLMQPKPRPFRHLHTVEINADCRECDRMPKQLETVRTVIDCEDI